MTLPFVIRNVSIPDFIKIDTENHNSQILEFLNNKKPLFEKWFEQSFKKKIETKDSWVNFTYYNPNSSNEFNWHNENGIGGSETVMEGSHAGIIWISGEENCGGELSVMTDQSIEVIDFKPETLIVIDKNMLHKVDNYTGSTPRISLVFTFNFL